jgi:hypothetical protein
LADRVELVEWAMVSAKANLCHNGISSLQQGAGSIKPCLLMTVLKPNFAQPFAPAFMPVSNPPILSWVTLVLTGNHPVSRRKNGATQPTTLWNFLVLKFVLTP